MRKQCARYYARGDASSSRARRRATRRRARRETATRRRRTARERTALRRGDLDGAAGRATTAASRATMRDDRARATTMRDAAVRWYDVALAPFARDALVVVDGEAAAQARACGGWGGTSGTGRARATAALETYATTDDEGDASDDVWDFKGERVPAEAPLVICVAGRLGEAAARVRRCVRARRRARSATVFVGCDEGDDAHGRCVEALTEACEKILSDAAVEFGEGATGDRSGDGRGDEDEDDEEDWGSWGDEHEARDDAPAEASREGTGDGWGDAPTSTSKQGRNRAAGADAAAGRFSVKFFPPMMYRALGDGAFTLPRSRTMGLVNDAAVALTGESKETRVIGHHLAEIAAHWALAPDYFALGPNAEAVSRVAAQAKTDPVGVDTTVKPRTAAIIVVDREVDLMTPSVSRDSWLERVLETTDDEDAASSSTYVDRVMATLSPLVSDENFLALDEALCTKTARDGAVYVRKLLREAARVESVAAPAADEKNARIVGADDILSLVRALEVDPSVALRHRALIQRAKLTARSLTNENDMKANRQIIALQRLTAAALERQATGVCATVVEILKVMYSAGGTAVGHPGEALALVLAAYVLATEANVQAQAPTNAASPFTAQDEASVRDALLGALLASDVADVKKQVPSFSAGALEAIEALRNATLAAAAAAPPTPSKDDDGWDDDDDDDWGEDEWGNSPTAPSKSTATNAMTAIDDPELAAAALEARDAVERALHNFALAAHRGRASLKHNVPESNSLYANGLPNPILLDIISRVKTSADDGGACADFVHVAASLGGLLKHAAATATASIVTGAMGRLGNLINKVTAAPKPSDRDVVVVFVLGALSSGEFAAALAARAPDPAAALFARHGDREFIFGALDLASARVIA